MATMADVNNQMSGLLGIESPAPAESTASVHLSGSAMADISGQIGQLLGMQQQAAPPATSSTGPVDANYIAKRAQDFGLDPSAVLGVAGNEGMGGGVGDNGTSFGPFQLHAGGALPAEVWAKGPDYAKQWAWSPKGIDYALQTMAGNGAKGLKGREAVDAIVYRFERPADPTADLNAGYAAVGTEK